MSIVIKYENGLAYSARNWQRFKDLDKEIAKMMAGVEALAVEQESGEYKDKTVSEQLSLW